MTLPTPRQTRRSCDTFHMSRYSLQDDLIGALVWLLSDASGFVTGVVVPVDGWFSSYSI